MDTYLLSYIDQRMAELGYKSYHHEPVSILTTLDTQEYVIPAYNEYLYLVSTELANGTVIRSDTRIFAADQTYSKQNLSRIQEFTGYVKIDNPKKTVQRIEFIRVTPK